MSLRVLFFAALLVTATTATAFAQTRLIMVEEAGCMWCARWNTQIAHIYPKTAEGRAAPLERMDIHAPHPADVVFKSKLRFTPTFVLVVAGSEVSRLEGYPGEDFFWGILRKMLENADVEIEY